MNLKKILLTCLILMILSVTAVSATDLNDVNATDSAEPTQEIEPVKTVEQDTNLQPISEKKTVALSNIKTTSTSPGTFDDLQLEINNARDNSLLVLTRDYIGHYGSRIHLDKDLTIDGQGHTLDCRGEGGCIAFFSTAGNIILKNIRIINGHNDLDGLGGAIHIEGSTKYTLKNCVFDNNWADDFGGAIYNEGDTLTIKNCTFTRNIADDCSGGAICSISDVIIEDSIFSKNKANSYGGAIFSIETVTINANQAPGPYSSFFDNNHAKKNDGGAIYAYDTYLKNVKFEENDAKKNGGAVAVQNHLDATDCLFNSNEAESEVGGAINCEYHGDDIVYLERCIFTHNNAGERGAGIDISNKDVYIDNCTFESNHAGIKGGAVCANRVYINTHQAENQSFNTYFIGNSVSHKGIASNKGGAIYVSSGGRIVNVYFKDNTAKVDGGAIYADENGNIEIDHCLFEGNSATGSTYQCYGGAICSDGDVYIHNSTFKNNYADDYGGAIYAKNVRINHDREYETADTFFIDNKAKDDDGGAIYAKDDVFARNVAFINNTAYVDGGAIYAGKNVEVIRSTFESNHATGAPSSRCYGGAIRAEENSKINNCNFKNNHADNRGGAVYASTVTIEGDKNTFEGNSAKDYGGAIYTDTFTNDVSHVSFINNSAGDGGAVYINSENWITFTDCVFMDNRASNKGGAIYMDSKYSHINIVNNIFLNNGASEGQSVYTYGYYDTINGNYWSTIPTEDNDQLVEWKAWPKDNIHHTDSNPVISFIIELHKTDWYVNVPMSVTVRFVHSDGTTTAPICTEYITMSEVDGIEIEDRKDSADGASIWFTPIKEGTYDLTFNLFGKTVTVTMNAIEAAISILPVPDIDGGIDIPEPYKAAHYIPGIKNN